MVLSWESYHTVKTGQEAPAGERLTGRDVWCEVSLPRNVWSCVRPGLTSSVEWTPAQCYVFYCLAGRRQGRVSCILLVEDLVEV